jgi:hypothetical protein
MKKILSILVIALVVVVAGCNKDKLYTKDLTGTWHVYKYLFKNVDETAQWLAANPIYTIIFSSNGTFVELNGATVHDTTINGVNYADTTYAYQNHGTYSFANHYVNLILTDSTYVLNDTVLVPTLTQRTYTIFDLSGSDVQLDTDTTQFYLAKNL